MPFLSQASWWSIRATSLSDQALKWRWSGKISSVVCMARNLPCILWAFASLDLWAFPCVWHPFHPPSFESGQQGVGWPLGAGLVTYMQLPSTNCRRSSLGVRAFLFFTSASHRSMFFRSSLALSSSCCRLVELQQCCIDPATTTSACSS